MSIKLIKGALSFTFWLKIKRGFESFATYGSPLLIVFLTFSLIYLMSKGVTLEVSEVRQSRIDTVIHKSFFRVQTLRESELMLDEAQAVFYNDIGIIIDVDDCALHSDVDSFSQVWGSPAKISYLDSLIPKDSAVTGTILFLHGDETSEVRGFCIPFRDNPIIVINMKQNVPKSTLIHEMGHLFGLGHHYTDVYNYMGHSSDRLFFNTLQTEVIRSFFGNDNG